MFGPDSRSSPASMAMWVRRGASVVLAGFVLASASCGGGDSNTPVEPEPEPDNPPTITLTSPNGGEALEPGSSVDVTWTASDDKAVVGVDLSYTADGGKSGTIATGVTGSSYTWTVPSEDLYGVKVKAVAKDAANQTAQDESDAIFAVVHVSARGYVTSSVCADCHEENYNEVKGSGHPYKVNKVVDGQPPTYPFSSVPSPPEGFTWNDITYVIGGYGWKARFMDKDGYILTTGVTGVNVQYNLPRADLADGLPESWSAYHSTDTEPKPYNCGKCHTTGWQSLEDNGGVHQDNLVGIEGTWEEPGIWCEQCHGPGGQHVVTEQAADITVDNSKELCGTCHTRDAQRRVEASGGFDRHHEQYDELISAGMKNLECGDCHDPHLGTRYGHAEAGGITATCESCHSSEAASNKHLVPLECTTCHMSRATKSARAVNSFQGDVRTHIFKINPEPFPRDSMFYEADGKTFNKGFMTLDVVCYQCHTDPVTGVGGGKTEKTLAELSAKAKGIHN